MDPKNTNQAIRINIIANLNILNMFFVYSYRKGHYPDDPSLLTSVTVVLSVERASETTSTPHTNITRRLGLKCHAPALSRTAVSTPRSTQSTAVTLLQWEGVYACVLDWLDVEELVSTVQEYWEYSAGSQSHILWRVHGAKFVFGF